MTTERETRELLTELLRNFYARNWISGTGGGICGPADDGGLLLAPTGVHKELVGEIQRVLGDPRFAQAFAIVVADHGAYIWGDDVMEAKRHAEVYHFLFEATVARHDRAQPSPKEGHR